MGIDKIRKRKKKTKKYKKRIPFWAGGESYGGDPSAGADDGGPGSGPSGPDGPSNGSDNSEPGVSPTPTPTTNFSDNSEPGVSPTPTVNFSDTNEPGVSPVATTSLLYDGPTYDEEVGINTPPTTPVNFSDTNEPGINPGPTMPVNYTDNSEPGINPGLYNPPTYVDNSNDNRLGILNNQNFAPDPKGGFKQGLMGVLKSLLLFAAPAVGGLAFGKKGYDLVNLGMKGKRAYDFAKKYAPTTTGKAKDLLTKNINFTPGSGGTKPPTGFNGSDNNEGNALVTKNVIAKSVQEYSPEEIKNVQNYVDRLNSYAEKGTLNKIGQQTLTQMNQVLKQYQV